jgi:hypothetical protein
MTPEEFIAVVREVAKRADEEYNKDHPERLIEKWWMDTVSNLDDLAEAMQAELDTVRFQLNQEAQALAAQAVQPEQ